VTLGWCWLPFTWPWAGSELQTQLSYVATPLPCTAVTFPAFRLVPNYTAWWQKHTCVNNLPRVVTWQWTQLGVKPTTSQLQVWCGYHCTTKHTFVVLLLLNVLICINADDCHYVDTGNTAGRPGVVSRLLIQNCRSNKDIQPWTASTDDLCKLEGFFRRHERLLSLSLYQLCWEAPLLPIISDEDLRSYCYHYQS